MATLYAYNTALIAVDVSVLEHEIDQVVYVDDRLIGSLCDSWMGPDVTQPDLLLTDELEGTRACLVVGVRPRDAKQCKQFTRKQNNALKAYKKGSSVNSLEQHDLNILSFDPTTMMRVVVPCGSNSIKYYALVNYDDATGICQAANVSMDEVFFFSENRDDSLTIYAGRVSAWGGIVQQKVGIDTDDSMTDTQVDHLADFNELAAGLAKFLVSNDPDSSIAAVINATLQIKALNLAPDELQVDLYHEMHKQLIAPTERTHEMVLQLCEATNLKSAESLRADLFNSSSRPTAEEILVLAETLSSHSRYFTYNGIRFPCVDHDNLPHFVSSFCDNVRSFPGTDLVEHVENAYENALRIQRGRNELDVPTSSLDDMVTRTDMLTLIWRHLQSIVH